MGDTELSYVSEILKKNFKSPFSIVEVNDVNVNIVESANSESYHEFTDGHAGRLK